MSYILPDHPYIRAVEWEGIAECAGPHCPVCGAACEQVYRNNDGDVFGCDVCVNVMDAWEMEECFQAVREAI